ncbi:hypothetical protein RHMOL_Rhmol02G0173400 [Rhododendron molle]|uniref:Uncharacterized protein n=1 Tax=Rhododendron molle TaxID=49168 RepID=A0ACC0PR08_RHOML|nr:hypothetical protein RHMOL_Rhmol02G0173400 [Rhododendron molle]
MADHGGSGGDRDVVDRPEDRGSPMETQTADQQPVEGTEGISAVATESGGGREGREQEVGDGETDRATEENPCATVLTGAVGSIFEVEGSGSVVEDPPIVGESSGGGGSSGAVGDDPGPNGSPPRDSAKGKCVVTEEEEATKVSVEYREQDVAFRPMATEATSSSHVPITKYDITEHLPDAMLTKLLEENPLIGEMVLRAKEERARAIAASEAAERTEREQKENEDLLRDAETEERAGAEA